MPYAVGIDGPATLIYGVIAPRTAHDRATTSERLGPTSSAATGAIAATDWLA